MDHKQSKERNERGEYQSQCIRWLINDGLNREQVINNLAKEFNSSLLWASGRMKIYEGNVKGYGRMGKNDPCFIIQRFIKDGYRKEQIISKLESEYGYTRRRAN